MPDEEAVSQDAPAGASDPPATEEVDAAVDEQLADESSQPAEPPPPPAAPEQGASSLDHAPARIEIEISPTPSVRVSVGLFGDPESDAQWVRYAYDVAEQLLGEREQFRAGMTNLGMAQLAAIRRAALRDEWVAKAAVNLIEESRREGRQGAQAPRQPAAGGNAQPRAPQARGGRPAQPAGQGDGRRRFPFISGYTCPRCGGACGVRARTGRQQHDSVVCLGVCENERGYPLEVAQL